MPRTVCSRDLMHATYAATVQLKNGASDVLVRGDAFRLVPSPVEAAAIAVRYRLGLSGSLRFRSGVSVPVPRDLSRVR